MVLDTTLDHPCIGNKEISMHPTPKWFTTADKWTIQWLKLFLCKLQGCKTLHNFEGDQGCIQKDIEE